MEEVILVDESDCDMSRMEKMQAHKEGRLHRAISVIIFDKKKNMLIQRRAMGKYHSAGKWTNACCSHPRPGEDVNDAAHRRLKEEMGFDCPLRKKLTFQYETTLDNDLIENELDHVFTGTYEGKVEPDPAEVMAYRWVPLSELLDDIDKAPDMYTYWFRIILDNFR